LDNVLNHKPSKKLEKEDKKKLDECKKSEAIDEKI
jgi:hypothetical protein